MHARSGAKQQTIFVQRGFNGRGEMLTKNTLVSALSLGLMLLAQSAGADTGTDASRQETQAASGSASVATPDGAGAGQAADQASADENKAKSAASAPATAKEQHAQTLEGLQVTSQFIASGARSAMKQDLDVRDTPYSVADYSSAFMKAIETANLTDLYGYMTGVQRGGATGYDLSIRGFKTNQADENAIMVDGLPGLAGRFGSPPTVMAERIEVVKGPASVLYGEAQPGGFVNIISKKPQDNFAASLDLLGIGYDGDGLSPGDANGGNLDVDVTGPIDAEKKFTYRVVAQDSSKDTFRGGFERGTYITPSATWHINDATSLRLNLEYRKRTQAYDNFLVAPNKDANLIADIKTKYQEPGDVLQETGESTTVALEHYFDNDAVFNFAWRSVHGHDTAHGYDNVSVLSDLTTLRRRARQQDNHRSWDYFDANYSIPFNTGSVGHKLLVGAGGGVFRTNFERIQFYNGPTSGASSKPGPGLLNIDIYDPVYGLVAPLDSYPTGPLNDRVATESNAGAYISDAMTLSDHWKASVGLRYTRDEQNSKTVKYEPFTSASKADSDVLPTAGILYQPDPRWSFYYSYASSFVAASPTVQDVDGNNSFKPTKAKQNEIGVKADLLDGRMVTTLALFDIQKTDVLAAATCNEGVGGNCSQQVGGEESKGVEWEVDARPVDNWQVIFGFAHINATVSDSNSLGGSPVVGSRLTNAPLNTAHIWSRYDFTEGALNGLGVGVGVVYASDTIGSIKTNSDSRVLVLPSYVVTDLAFYYKFLERYTVTFKIGNLFDKKYYEGVNSTTNENGIVPGAPRYYQVALHVPFQ
jgi:iron complex outermembrane recepter protein